MLTFALAAALGLAADGTPPPYYTAQERWRCSFKWANKGEAITSYFGIYRSHVEDDFTSDLA